MPAHPFQLQRDRMEKDVYWLSVGQHLPERADRPALTWGARTLSFAALDRAVSRRARWLQRIAGPSTSCVGLMFDAQSELALTVLALTRLRRPFLSIPRATAHGQALEWCAGAGVGIALTDCPQRCDGLPGVLPCPPIGSEEASDDLEALTETVPADGPGADDRFTVIGGSGSTGRRKLIPVSQVQMCNRILDAIESLQISESDHTVGLIHLEFASAQHRLLAALSAGGRVSLIEPWADDWLAQLQLSRATMIVAGVVHCEALLRTTDTLASPALPEVRALTIGGSTVADALRAQVMERLTPNVWVLYGSNECWFATVAPPQMVRTVPGTIGMASSRSEVRIANARGAIAAQGEVGRIAVRNLSLPRAYLDGTPEENIRLSNGWFDTGDLGRQLPDGQIVFLGRQDNMMIFNGVNIYPSEIEQCAMTFPGVAQAAAFPMRHPVHQSVPLCAVAFRPDALPDGQGLMRHLARGLGFKAPLGLFLFDALPLIAHGKPSVREIIGRIEADNLQPITLEGRARDLSE